MAKIRAIVNGVHFYTCTRAIVKQTVSDSGTQNTALFVALDKMGRDRGIATTVVVYNSRMKRSSYDVQLTVV